MSQAQGLPHCGTIALVGRPNVGKSTLLNALLGEKISITSPKAQTTQLNLRGIKTIGQNQFIYVDTPGLHKNKRSDSQKRMLREVTGILTAVDALVFIMEYSQFTEEDQWLLNLVQQANVPVVLVLNKVDQLKDKTQLLPRLSEMQQKFPFVAILPLSALKKINVKELEKCLLELLPQKEHRFPADQHTEYSQLFFISELIREQIYRQTHSEVPYASKIEIEKIEDFPRLIRVYATIWVGRDGHKKILIGKGGQQLKNIGRLARLQLEKILNKKLYLQLIVRVEESGRMD